MASAGLVKQKGFGTSQLGWCGPANFNLSLCRASKVYDLFSIVCQSENTREMGLPAVLTVIG